MYVHVCVTPVRDVICVCVLQSRHVSSKPLCGASEPCRWAVCAWSQQRISTDQCDFIVSE